MSPQETSTIHNDPAAVATRLAGLDLGEADLVRAVQDAFAEAFDCTTHDPPSMAGFIAWGKTVRYLRDRLVPRGWTPANDRNYSTVVHPTGSIAIAVASGDANTGVASRVPSTQYEKGPATTDAVLTNQMTLGDLVPSFPVHPSATQTWLLLHHFDETNEEIRMELSLPDGISEGGHVTSWRERLLLSPVPGFPTTSIEIRDAGEDIDVPVRRLSS